MSSPKSYMLQFSFRFFCFGWLLLPTLLSAQRKQVLFQDKAYQTCDSARASYRVELHFTDASEKGCRLKRFWMDGQLMEEISYSDYEKRIKNGPEVEYYTSGQVKIKTHWLADQRHDSLNTFYRNGIRKRAELYREGNWVSGKCFGSSGADTVYFPLENEPVFPGSLAEFVAENTRYPRKARRKSIEGQVLVSFVITRSGKVTDIQAVQPADEMLAKEAERVVRQMPDWRPGTFDGEPVNVRMRLPFRFKLQQNSEPDSRHWSE